MSWNPPSSGWTPTTGGQGLLGPAIRSEFWDATNSTTVGTGWAVTAPTSNSGADPVSSQIAVRLFDASTPEGLGIRTACPIGASALRIRIRVRATVNPVGAKVGKWELYGQTIGTAVGDWSAAVALTDTSHAGGAVPWTTAITTVPIASLGLVAGQPCLLELVRDADAAGDTVTADIALMSVILDWI